MLNAKEAREKVEDLSINELKNIENKIIKAVRNGEYEICIDGVIKEKTKTILKELGYSVKYVSRYNEGGTIIEW